MTDPYLDMIKEQWPNICALYNEHAEYYPVMLVDVHDAEIHAFPYSDLSARLDPSSQEALEAQYSRAVVNRQMVLFVRDTSRKVMQSYTLELEDTAT